MDIRTSTPINRLQSAASKRALEENPSKTELERGISNCLLGTTDRRVDSDHPAHVLPSTGAARKALKELKSGDFDGLVEELNTAKTRAEKQWALSLLMPVGAMVGFAALLGALPAVAGLSGAAALGVAGMGALVKSNQNSHEAGSAMKGLQRARRWADRDDVPETISRNGMEQQLQADIDHKARQGDLTRLWRLKRLESSLNKTQGDSSLDILTNMGEKEQLKTVEWLREKAALNDSSRPELPGETTLAKVTEKVEKVLAQQLGKNDFLGAKRSLGTLSLLEESGVETWSDFVDDLVEKHDLSIRWNEAGEFGTLFGPQNVERVQRQVADALSAASNEDSPRVGKPKSRAEVQAMLDGANEIPLLADFPKENKARRIFRKLPGKDLQEMVSRPGSKNRDRSQVLLQALHDCQLEWVIGTD